MNPRGYTLSKKWISGFMLGIFLFSLVFSRLHLLSHSHFEDWDPLPAADSRVHPDDDENHDHDHDHHPHPAADHELLAWLTPHPGPVADLNLDSIISPLFPFGVQIVVMNGERDSLAIPGPSPPAFHASWQFSFRTALPARAPSIFA